MKGQESTNNSSSSLIDVSSEIPEIDEELNLQPNFKSLNNMRESIIFSLIMIYSGTFLITMPKSEGNDTANYHGIIILIYLFFISFFAILNLYPSKSGVEKEIECMVKMGNLQQQVHSSAKISKSKSQDQLRCFVKEQQESPALELLIYWTIWVIYGVVCSTFLKNYGNDVKLIILSSVFLIISLILAYDRKMLTNKIYFFINLFIFKSNIFLLSILNIPYYSIYYSEEIYLVFTKVTIFVLLYFLNHIIWSNLKREYIKKNDGIQMKAENCILVDRGSIYHSVIISASIKFIQSSWVLYSYKYTLLLSSLQLIYLTKTIFYHNKKRNITADNPVKESQTAPLTPDIQSNSLTNSVKKVGKLLSNNNKSETKPPKKTSKSEKRTSSSSPSSSPSSTPSSTKPSKKKDESKKSNHSKSNHRIETVIDIDEELDNGEEDEEDIPLIRNKSAGNGKATYYLNKYRHLLQKGAPNVNKEYNYGNDGDDPLNKQ